MMKWCSLFWSASSREPVPAPWGTGWDARPSVLGSRHAVSPWDKAERALGVLCPASALGTSQFVSQSALGSHVPVALWIEPQPHLSRQMWSRTHGVPVWSSPPGHPSARLEFGALLVPLRLRTPGVRAQGFASPRCLLCPSLLNHRSDCFGDPSPEFRARARAGSPPSFPSF